MTVTVNLEQEKYKLMEERVLKVLNEQCEEILNYDGDNLIEDGIIDSFTVIRVVSDLEEEFDIEINAKYVIAENLKNKDTIIALVKKVLAEGV